MSIAMTSHSFHVRRTPGGALFLRCCQCPKTSSREQWVTELVEACPGDGTPEYDFDHAEKTGAPYEKGD